MPFVCEKCRMVGHKPCAVGDLCYNAYRYLIISWRLTRRWTTAHNLLKDLAWWTLKEWATYRTKYGLADYVVASILAYKVFFNKEVMVYEDEKEKENGKI